MGDDGGLRVGEDQRAAEVKDVGRACHRFNPHQHRRRQRVTNLFLLPNSRDSHTCQAHATQMKTWRRGKKNWKKRWNVPGLWDFVLKVPITTHRFSNLRWQEADGSGRRQRELHQRIPPALIIIFMITITITVVLFRCVQCVKTCHFAAKKPPKKPGGT